MMRNKNIAGLGLLVLALIVSIQARLEADGPGITAVNFLKIGAGTRAAGMGEAFTAVSNDGEAMAWNVAGLTQLVSHEAMLMHTEWLQQIGYEYMAYGQPLSNDQSIGVSLVYLHLDNLNVTDEVAAPGDPIGATPVATQQSVSANDTAFTLAYSWKVDPQVSIGAGIKYIEQSLVGSSDQDFAADLGYLYLNKDDGWSLGGTVQNLGPAMSGFPLPMTIRAGLAQRVRISDLLQLYSAKDMPASERRDILFALDLAETPGEGIFKSSVGTEWRFVFGWQYVAVRSGVDLDFSKNGKGLFTLGLGYVLGGSLIEWEVDYAYVPFGVLGDAHRMSLAARF